MLVHQNITAVCFRGTWGSAGLTSESVRLTLEKYKRYVDVPHCAVTLTVVVRI